MKVIFSFFILMGTTFFALAPEKQADAYVLAKETPKAMRQINLGDKNIPEIFLNSFSNLFEKGRRG